MTSFSNYLAERREAQVEEELLAKIAAVEEAWAGDENRIARLSEATDIVKQAMEEGSLSSDLSRSEQFSLAVDLVEASFEDDEQVKEASEEGYYEDVEEGPDFGDEELNKEAAEQVIGLGRVLGQRLAELGVTVDDLEKIAEDEQEAFGRHLAQLTAEILGEDEESR